MQRQVNLDRQNFGSKRGLSIFLKRLFLSRSLLWPNYFSRKDNVKQNGDEIANGYGSLKNVAGEWRKNSK